MNLTTAYNSTYAGNLKPSIKPLPAGPNPVAYVDGEASVRINNWPDDTMGVSAYYDGERLQVSILRQSGNGLTTIDSHIVDVPGHDAVVLRVYRDVSLMLAVAIEKGIVMEPHRFYY